MKNHGRYMLTIHLVERGGVGMHMITNKGVETHHAIRLDFQVMNKRG